MAKKQVTIAALSIAVTVVVLGALVYFLFASDAEFKYTPPARITEEAPRNYFPMAEYTAYFKQKTLTVNNHNYTYFWYQPEQPWPPNIKFPLVMVLHGATGKAYAAKYLISQRIKHNYPAFIFIPAIQNGRYWALPSGETLDRTHAMPDMVDMIKALGKQYPVDMTRLYVVGCSDGGTGAYGAVRYFPDFFAAAVPISGSWHPEDGVNMTSVPMWVFHGRNDRVIPAEQARHLAQIAKSRGGKVYYSEFANMGHNCPSPLFYTEDMWKWLFSQKRS